MALISTAAACARPAALLPLLLLQERRAPNVFESQAALYTIINQQSMLDCLSRERRLGFLCLSDLSELAGSKTQRQHQSPRRSVTRPGPGSSAADTPAFRHNPALAAVKILCPLHVAAAGRTRLPMTLGDWIDSISVPHQKYHLQAKAKNTRDKRETRVAAEAPMVWKRGCLGRRAAVLSMRVVRHAFGKKSKDTAAMRSLRRPQG